MTAGTCPICYDRGHVYVTQLVASDDARVAARDNAVVTAYDNAIVCAADRVHVYAFGRATVYAAGRVHVVVYSPDVTVYILSRDARAEVGPGAGDWRHDWRPAAVRRHESVEEGAS